MKGKALTPVFRIKTASFATYSPRIKRHVWQLHLTRQRKKTVTRKPYKEEMSSILLDQALVLVLGVAKHRQDLNTEEVSSTPGAKANKKQNSEESSSRNAKDRKTESSVKDKVKSVKKSLAKVVKPSTVSWSSWTKNGLKGLADWRLCFYQGHLPSQSRFSSQWSSLQLNLHQPVL